MAVSPTTERGGAVEAPQDSKTETVVPSPAELQNTPPCDLEELNFIVSQSKKAGNGLFKEKKYKGGSLSAVISPVNPHFPLLSF